LAKTMFVLFLGDIHDKHLCSYDSLSSFGFYIGIIVWYILLTGGASRNKTNLILTVYLKEPVVFIHCRQIRIFWWTDQDCQETIRPLRIRIGNNAGKHSSMVHQATNVGRDTVNIVLSKKGSSSVWQVVTFFIRTGDQGDNCNQERKVFCSKYCH